MARAYTFPRWRRWPAWRLAFGAAPTPRRATPAPASPREQQRLAEVERLFARYQAPLLDYLFGMTHDYELAADLTQETFMRALTAAQQLDAVTNPQAWLYRIATNAALNVSRRQRRFRWLPLGRLEGDRTSTTSSSDRWRAPTLPQAQAHLYDDFATDVAERDAVWRTLVALPPRWRAVLLLQTTAGFSAREIAASLGLEEGNVRKILFRAKERFRALYTQMNDQPQPARQGPVGPIGKGGRR